MDMKVPDLLERAMLDQHPLPQNGYSITDRLDLREDVAREQDRLAASSRRRPSCRGATPVVLIAVALGASGIAAAVVTLAVSLSAFDVGTGRGLRAEAINETLWLVEDNRLPCECRRVCAVLLARSAPLPLALAGMSAGLAFLAHGSSLVALLAVAPLAVIRFHRPRRAGRRGEVVAGVTLVAVCAVPWLAYQQWYDPPSDRLTKYFLTGVTAAGDERSLIEALRDRYGELGAGEILDNKLNNVLAYVRGEPGVPRVVPDRGCRTAAAVGSAGHGRRRRGRTARRGPDRGAPEAPRATRRAHAWSWLVVAATLLWGALVHFGTAFTLPVPHKLGFAPVLLAGALLASALLSAPRWLRWPVIAVHVGVFALLWVVAPWRDPAVSEPIAGLDLVALAVAFASGLSLATALGSCSGWQHRPARRGIGRRDDPYEPHPHTSVDAT